jgi:hypothetical protein
VNLRRLAGSTESPGASCLLKVQAGIAKGGNVEFVMFEDVDGMEVFVNPEHVIWVREYPGEITVISCGHEDKFRVRLSPALTVAALGRSVR